MIKNGDTLYNPATGESMTFLVTAAKTAGDYVLIELRADPDAVVAAAHVHPAQTETFEVVEGMLGVMVAGRSTEATAGDVLVVEPGQSHKWWNAGDSPLVFRCRIEPALHFESLIETMFALAADGKTNKKGIPNSLRLAVIANAHLDTVVLPFPPVWIQKAALALGAPMGRALGFGPTYQSQPVAPATPALSTWPPRTETRKA
jgi:mannose-6-phosphate isomerase-like protein (cupin superfamily)